MDELEARLQEEASHLRSRAGDIAATDTSLRALRMSADLRSHRDRWVVRSSAALAVAAALMIAFVIVRPHDSGPSISGDSEAGSVPTSAIVPETAATATSAIPTSGSPQTNPPTTAASPPESASIPINSSSTPFDRCTYTDPGKYGISVARALTCPDGTTIDVSGVSARDDEGVVWVCDQLSGSSARPCVGDGLRLLGDVEFMNGWYSGVKHGDSLLLRPVAEVRVPSTSSALGPVIVGPPVNDIVQAPVGGVVNIIGTCVMLEAGTSSRVIVWPAGTQWERNRREIVLPDGRRISDGATISGAGGSVSVDRLLDFEPLVVETITGCLPPGSDATTSDAVVFVVPDTVTDPAIIQASPISTG